jgi:hypothetical protein
MRQIPVIYKKKRPRPAPEIYDRKDPKYDYLKFWRVVRYWAKQKYGITTADLDMLLFLHSEGLFTRVQCENYGSLMSWDKQRFNKLLRDGWINKWRKSINHEKALYEVSYKAKKFIISVYKKLNGEEKIAETARRNPIFNNRTCNSTDRIYRHAIRQFNAEVNPPE